MKTSRKASSPSFYSPRDLRTLNLGILKTRAFSIWEHASIWLTGNVGQYKNPSAPELGLKSDPYQNHEDHLVLLPTTCHLPSATQTSQLSLIGAASVYGQRHLFQAHHPSRHHPHQALYSSNPARTGETSTIHLD